MKKLLSCAICLIFIGNVFGQEKFTIPERTPEQKHQTTMFQYHAMVAAGIHFAKSQGISPYEYGKYVGDLVAQTWNNENGFDRYVNMTIFSLEDFRTDADIPLEIIEKDDSSVIIKFSTEISGKFIQRAILPLLLMMYYIFGRVCMNVLLTNWVALLNKKVLRI
mgnify:CR=1 FL=1